MKEEKHARARDGPPAVTPELEAKAFEEGLWGRALDDWQARAKDAETAA